MCSATLTPLLLGHQDVDEGAVGILELDPSGDDVPVLHLDRRLQAVGEFLYLHVAVPRCKKRQGPRSWCGPLVVRGVVNVTVTPCVPRAILVLGHSVSGDDSDTP